MAGSMDNTNEVEGAAPAPEEDNQPEFWTVGQQLQAARTAKGLSLQDVATQTKVPIRHLQSIEKDQFGDLPGRTYAIGFAKAYARVVELSDARVAADMRSALDASAGEARRSGEPVSYAKDDGGKVPSFRTALLAALLGVGILAAGFGIWRAYFFPGADIAVEDIAGEEAQQASATPTPAESATSDARQVVFTATVDNVWVKFYDGNGDQLFQKQMALGEQYVVPSNADNPQITTGRPDAFTITVDGKPVPPLATSVQTIQDVPVSAAALLARAEARRPAPSATTAPAPASRDTASDDDEADDAPRARPSPTPTPTTRAVTPAPAPTASPTSRPATPPPAEEPAGDDEETRL